MRFRKKVISILLAAAFAVVPIGCGGGEKPSGGSSAAPHKDIENAVVKKGVCVSRYNTGKDLDPMLNRNLTLAQSAKKVVDLDVGWYYNWSYAPRNTQISGIEFVPMIWGRGDVNQTVLDDIKTKYESGVYTHLLTFNEPDLPDQSSMTPDQALSFWDDLEAVGIPLSSPAVSSYSAEDGNEWLDEFMEKADRQGKRVDFMTIHIYQSFYRQTAVNDLKKTLTALYNKYNRPIWLTEFAAVDIESRDAHLDRVNPSCTEKNAQNYIKQATSMLEQCGFVERYSWFTDNFGGRYGSDRPWEAPYTTLYDDDDNLSGTGKTYKDVSSNYPIEIETASLPDAKRLDSYNFKISVGGGTGDYTFSASGLPAGLSVSTDGTISGKPKTTGTFAVNVTITDSGKPGRRQTLTHKFSITIK